MNESEPALIDPRSRVIEIVESFPNAIADPVAGLHLRLEIMGKRFGWYMENHHGDQRLQINCKALPGVSQALVEKNAVVYHIPKYVGNKGWVGIWVDVPGVDWSEVRDLLFDAYELTVLNQRKTKKVPKPPKST